MPRSIDSARPRRLAFMAGHPSLCRPVPELWGCSLEVWKGNLFEQYVGVPCALVTALGFLQVATSDRETDDVQRAGC